MKSIKKQLDRVQLTDTKVKVVMPEKVLNQIKYLCKEIHAVEWSGILYYSIDGSIKDPGNMTLTLQSILPMHKGTQSYTEYSFDERVVNFMMEEEDAMDWKMAHIHSHNNMAVFFSGTDWGELEDNAPNHNFYLSLIVNNRMDFCAKVCFIADTDTEEVKLSYFAKDEHGNRYEYGKHAVTTKKDKLIVYDCDIKTPELNKPDESFMKSVAHIIEKAKPKHIPYTPPTRNVYGGNRAQAGFKSTHINTNKRKSELPKAPYRFISGKEDRKVVPSNDFQNRLKTTQEKTNKSFNSWATEEVATQVAKPLVDAIEDPSDIDQAILENYSMFLLNGGQEADIFKDLEEVVQQYEAMNMSFDAIATPIINKYGEFYAQFFRNTEDSQNTGFFIETTTDVIQEINDVACVSRNMYIAGALETVANRLERLLANFIKGEKKNG